MKFEVGKTYYTRSACDHECIFEWKVVRRTAKSVWLKEEGKHYRDEPVRRRSVKDWGDGIETVFPDGHYSMCPVLTAERFWKEDSDGESTR
jgi:hypothetical protein